MPAIDQIEQTDQEQSYVVDAIGAAQILGISVRHFHQLRSKGQMIAATRLGTNCRWSRAEVMRYFDAGCPSCAEWQRLRKTA